MSVQGSESLCVPVYHKYTQKALRHCNVILLRYIVGSFPHVSNLKQKEEDDMDEVITETTIEMGPDTGGTSSLAFRANLVEAGEGGVMVVGPQVRLSPFYCIENLQSSETSLDQCSRFGKTLIDST